MELIKLMLMKSQDESIETKRLNPELDENKAPRSDHALCNSIPSYELQRTQDVRQSQIKSVLIKKMEMMVHESEEDDL
jgi:hypothetical protein